MNREKVLYIAVDDDEGMFIESFFRALGWKVERNPEAVDCCFYAAATHKHLHSVPSGAFFTAEFNASNEAEKAAAILKSYEKRSRLVVVRGAGDLATGTIVKLRNAGYSVIATEIAKPSVIRRTVSLAEAVYSGKAEVEGVSGVYAGNLEDIPGILESGSVPVIIDPELTIVRKLKPEVLVDAAIAKRNLGTTIDMAPFVVALGPGFTAGADADAVIETKRGHSLGRIIRSGTAIANTGVPGNIEGYTSERVIHSPASGIFEGVRSIGDIVRKGDIIARVGDYDILASIDGKLRGLLRSGLHVPQGFKVADIDPRGEKADHLTISDKARAIAGGVLEAVDAFMAKCD